MVSRRIQVESGNPWRQDGGRFGESIEQLVARHKENQFKEISAETNKLVTDEQKKMIADFTGDSWFLLNRGLRHPDRAADDPDWDDRLALWDEMMAEHELQENIILYRAFDGRRAAKIIDGLQIGDKLTDHGFMSTTTDLSVAEGWQTGPDDGPATVIMILAARGTKAIGVSGMAKQQSESEVIVNRSTTLVLKGEINAMKVFQIV